MQSLMKRERGVVEMANSDTSPPFRRRAFFMGKREGYNAEKAAVRRGMFYLIAAGSCIFGRRTCDRDDCRSFEIRKKRTLKGEK
jgi:hypothetical protein